MIASPRDVAAIAPQLLRFKELFVEAFDELHAATTENSRSKKYHIGPHSHYPIMTVLDNGFPSFSEAGFYNDGSPRDYVGAIRPTGLFAIFGGGHGRPDSDFVKSLELRTFLQNNDIGERLRLGSSGTVSRHQVNAMVAHAVERYIHLFGLTAPVDVKRRDAILRPLIRGVVFKELSLRLVIPVTLTHFDVHHYRLTDTSYIVKLPKKLQLARGSMSTRGTGAVDMVVGAATHAFVSNQWHLDVDDVDTVRRSLNDRSPSGALDAADSFLAALRIVTGISAGYAQLLWAPRAWALEYFCDLTPVYGTTVRRYPSHLDNFGWIRTGETVPKEALPELRRVYRAIIESESEAMRLALRRLNGCLSRTDAADAILDGTIGLELLLGDTQGEALSYKLRLRAAALASLRNDPAFPPQEVSFKVKRLYEARSAIVHGQRKTRSKRALESASRDLTKERLLAAELLRFVLDVLLIYPQFQDEPLRIDSGLLLRGDDLSLGDIGG
ncbi:hypothetical protein ABIA95_003116 [Bradyrhizobium sp. LA8.1]|uniref:hypothetical protein n=1 Tax=unclassified Bradyrhizobium TaxID=2631580 RepID=UPI003393E95E